MNLMHEDLARAHMAQRHEEARRQRLAVRAVRAHRAARRAERAAQRAHRLLALVAVR
jgi:hypothetical protein